MSQSPKAGTFKTNPSIVLLVVAGFAALLLQGCVLVPFENVTTGAAIYGKREVISINLERTPDSWGEHETGRYGGGDSPTIVTYERHEVRVPQYYYSVAIRNMQTNEEVRLCGGDTSLGYSSSVSIYPLAQKPPPPPDEVTYIELDPLAEWGPTRCYHDVPPGSYLVVVRWSRPNGSWHEEQWPRGNIMTTTTPFTVE